MNSRTLFLILGGAACFSFALYQGDAACPRGARLAVQAVAAQAQPEAQAKTKPEGKAKSKAKGEAKQPAKPALSKEVVAAHKEVLANVRTFTESFNKQDVPALLKLFTKDCVLTEADGTTSHGLKELEEDLKDQFKEEPKAKLSTSVESLRLITPNVLLEEGKTMFYPDGVTLTAETDYEATHVKQGNAWLMSRVRSFNRTVVNPYDQLRELDWLVGDWVDESSDSVVESSYRWDINKSFLLNKFTVRVNGQKALTGTQRIGRDPLSKQLKAWVFDSEGGYAESLWSNVGDSWVMKATGVRADGTVVSMTNQLTQLSKDRMRYDSADRVVGDERQLNVSVIIVRRPPQTKKK